MTTKPSSNHSPIFSVLAKFFFSLGHVVLSFLSMIGEVFLYYLHSLRSLLRGNLDWERTFLEMNAIGVNSLPIVIIISSFTGMVISLHLSKAFVDFGVTSQMGHLLTLAFSRELAPVLTGVVVAGRAGSAIAAEIGSMSVTEQLDALKTLSTDPIDFLIAPKIFASFLMLPLLIVIANISGVLAGMWLAVHFKTITVLTFLDSILTYIKPWDFIGGIIKGFFFGLIIAGIGTYYGSHTENGAAGVGVSTTKTVVASTIFLFIINYFLSAFLYEL
ncbi:MAG TPA: ABC transporter permease [Firmicutes bacterium]|jgi:phospholipid/cholesterol/gamma-HCH transport system permease protein|nr:ABC transporter permease [Bacillota bacterium]HBT16960.1 ABC transporter permease [Bacillota bacterium]